MRWIGKSTLEEKSLKTIATPAVAKPLWPDPRPTTDDEKQHSGKKDRRT